MERKYKRLKTDTDDEIAAIEQVIKELLTLSYNPPSGEIPVFNKNIVDRLNPYRGFRHLFVSGYGFKLRLELMSSLINSIDALWVDIKQAVEEFWNKLQVC
jgi:hypothetical protein